MWRRPVTALHSLTVSHRPFDTSLSHRWGRNSHILLAIVCAVNFQDVDLWMSNAKISWRSLKRVHVPIVIIHTKWTWLVFINETTPQISCLLCFNVVGLNCYERKCQYEVTFDIWRNTKIISVCLVFSLRVFPANSDTVRSLAVIRHGYVLYWLPRLNITITRARVYTRIHRMIKKSPYFRIWYLRATLVRSAVSRSCDWSPWTRSVASEASRPHPTWFLLAGAFEGHAVPGETTKYGQSKRTHYRCICAHNTRCSSPWEGETNPCVILP